MSDNQSEAESIVVRPIAINGQYRVQPGVRIALLALLVLLVIGGLTTAGSPMGARFSIMVTLVSTVLITISVLPSLKVWLPTDRES